MINNKDAVMEKYHELAFYTLAHTDPAFIHQHIVDAFAAQNADEQDKPIRPAFALLGLYLFLERDYTGKQVQRAHMLLTQRRKRWPSFSLPAQRGDVTAADVVMMPPGKQRDQMIRTWCVSVWQSYASLHKEIADLWEQTMAD